MTSWLIRAARPEDLSKIAQLQAQSWAETYQGILPADYISGQMRADIDLLWDGLPEGDVVLCGLNGQGDLAGFAAVRRKAGAPYLDNLHLHTAARGSGLAAKLMAAVATTLRAQGEASLWLTVVDTNARARAFYAKLGGVEDAVGPDDMFGQPCLSHAVRWGDLSQLEAMAKKLSNGL